MIGTKRLRSGSDDLAIRAEDKLIAKIERIEQTSPPDDRINWQAMTYGGGMTESEWFFLCQDICIGDDSQIHTDSC